MSIIHPFTAARQVSSVEAKPARHGIRAPKGGCTVNGRTFKGGQFCWPYDPVDPHGKPAVAPAPIRLAIHGFVYTVKEIDPGECGTVAFRMHRIDTNHNYDVIRNHFGEVTCECGDFEFRRAGSGRPCKHGVALIQAGMMPAPTPANRVEPEAQFNGRALWAYARDRRAINAVIAFGQANDYPAMVIHWSPDQAAAAYHEIVEAVEGMVVS